MADRQQLSVITKTYDLILWTCQHTTRFPRNHRYGLGERIERKLYDLLETLIEARFQRERGPLLERANLQLEVLRFQVRLAKDLNCLKLNSGDDLFTAQERRRGIPIGNQTSQFFANVYLDSLDHFVKENLRMPGYVRYVDDFLVFSNDKRQLADARDRIREFLVDWRLKLHPDKSVVFPVREGIRFLGYRVFPTHLLLTKDNLRRFRRRVRKMQTEFAERKIGTADVKRRLMSWSGNAGQADTYVLRRRLFSKIIFQRAKAVEPRVARKTGEP